jgi:ParB family chromosome partitioning protein
LKAEYDRLEEEYAQADELPDEVDQLLGEIETALATFEARAVVYDPTEIARAGVFVSIDADGDLRIERGYVRPEDEAPAEPVEGSDGDAPAAGQPNGAIQRTVITVGSGDSSEPEPEADDDEGLKPLSERLITELTAHRTLALRDALANDPNTAFVAVLYTLCLGAFYRMSSATCLEISAKSSTFNAQAPGLADCASANAIEARHQQWAKQLPKAEDDLWDVLMAFDTDSQAALLAHCASLSVNAVHEPWSRGPRRLAHADTLSRAVNLDMAAAGWSPTVDNYLGRVPKARILEAVREAKGEQSAQLIDHLKKADMAKEAERLLGGTGWLPDPLRTPETDPADTTDGNTAEETEALLAFLADDDDESSTSADGEDDPACTIAAE